MPWRAMLHFRLDIHTDPRRAVCAMLRDLHGPELFRPVALDPPLLTSTAVALATTIYDTKSFDLMPVLADALEDAGCSDAEILGHCRAGGGGHVRGCWVCDVILGKT